MAQKSCAAARADSNARLWTVLVLIDALLSVGQLEVVAASLGAPSDVLVALHRDGLVETRSALRAAMPPPPAAWVAAAPAPLVSDAERFRSIQKFMNDTVVDAIGLRDFSSCSSWRSATRVPTCSCCCQNLPPKRSRATAMSLWPHAGEPSAPNAGLKRLQVTALLKACCRGGRRGARGSGVVCHRRHFVLFAAEIDVAAGFVQDEQSERCKDQRTDHHFPHLWCLFRCMGWFAKNCGFRRCELQRAWRRN